MEEARLDDSTRSDAALPAGLVAVCESCSKQKKKRRKRIVDLIAKSSHHHHSKRQPPPHYLGTCDTIRYLKQAVHTRQETGRSALSAAACQSKAQQQRNRQAGGNMARKSTPQPLNLAEPTTVNDERDLLDSPISPSTPSSPKSLRSPFRFTGTKKGLQIQGDQSLRAVDPRRNPTANLPLSQTTGSLSTLQSSSAVSSGEERQERDRPVRTGFFSNYKASKSLSRLQPQDAARRVSEESMSRDTDHPQMSGKVSSQEVTRSGTTHLVSSRLFSCYRLTSMCSL